MDRPAKLLIGALLGLVGVSAFAFVFPAPPPGFGGSPGNWTFTVPNGAEQMGKIIHQSKGLDVPVGGAGKVNLPVSYKFTGGAARVAAGIVFANPYVRTAAGIAGWLLTGKLIWDEVDKVWRQLDDDVGSGANQYQVNATAAGNQWWPSPTAACQHVMNYWASADPSNLYVSSNVVGGECVLVWRPKSGGANTDYVAGPVISRTNPNAGECPVGWTSTPAGCLSPAVPQPQFEDILEPKPMPDTVPWELPYPSPLPVEQPWINPAPGPNPEHRPKFVPTGDPVKNPNYNPNAEPSPTNQPFIQPGVRLNPSPTLDEPFRIDNQPVDRPQPNGDPTGPVDEGPGQTNPGDKPQEQSDLCEKHPDIVACAKMDDVKPDDVNNQDKTLVITPEQGWGNENATCPAPVTKQVAGLNLEMSWQPFCDFATGIRPVVIAMAWLSAVLLVLGIARKES